jgi:transcriptional regulator with XRE-family HTH domain
MADSPLDRARLRAKRRESGLTQKQLAELAGVSLSYIKYLENGPTEPSRPYLQAVAAALHCKPAELLTGPERDAA